MVMLLLILKPSPENFPDLDDLLDLGVTIVLAAPTTEMRDGTA